jgi:signal transduction histidine kinase
MRLSIRSRLTLWSTISILVVLIIIAFSFRGYTVRALTANAQANVANALSRAQNEIIVGKVSEPGRLVLPIDGDAVVQITNYAGTRVWAATSTISNQPVLAVALESNRFASGLGPVLVHRLSTAAIDRQLSLGIAVPIETKRGLGLAFGWYYGTAINHSERVFRTTISLFFGALWIVASLLLWLSIGRTLSPVETIRRRVSTIAATGSHERVPVPSGRDEFARLATTVNEMLDRLDDATRFQQQFVSNASHELRSPLTTLLATVDLAVSRSDDADWPTVAATVQREGRRLHTLIDDLFWLARSDEGRVEMRKTQVDLDDILYEEADRVRLMSPLKVDTRSITPARVWGDPNMLTRAVRNLVDNAMRYATSSISLSSRFDGVMCIIEVHDDGVGVDVATAAKYFERFVREDASRTRSSGGTGLGLTIVADIASRHGGSAAFVPATSGSTVQLRVRRI